MARIEQQFRIAEIDVSRIATEDTISGVFRFEQANNAGRGPTILIIADIESTLYVYERFLDLLNETTERARLMVTAVGQDPVARFEKLIQRLNESIGSFGEQEAAPISWKRINIYVIELSDRHLCFSGVGRLTNAFFQKQEDGSYRAFDLFGSLEQPVQVDPKKPFASIVCGDIKSGDVLIAGTNNLERLRAELQFKERLTSLPPITAALEIRNDLEKRDMPGHFIAAVISCQEIKTPEPETAPKEKPQPSKDRSTESIEKLRGAEEEALHRLAPVLPAVNTFDPEKLKKIASDLVERIRVKLTPQKRNPVDNVALASLRSMNAGYGNSLTKKRKLIIAGIVGVIVLAIIGTVWWKHAQRVAAEVALWNSTYDSAADMRNRAESDLIYGNDSRASAELATAQQSIADLPTDSTDRKTRIDKLNSDISDLKDRLKKLVKTENITELTTLGNAAGSQLAAPVLVSDSAYVADNSNGVILKISLTSKTVKSITLPKNTGTIIAGTAGKDNILFATGDGKLVSVKKSDDSISSVAWNHTKSSSTTDVVLYGSKLYSLDPTQNQVWRATGSGSSYGSEGAYIKATSAPLTDAVSMAIDSSVYILKNDGTLLRFLSGGQEGFALSPIDPPLRAASAIWTTVDATNLIIADPAGKRLLEFDKNGTLKAQIISSQFNAPRDLDADEANKRILLVDGNRLLLVPMP